MKNRFKKIIFFLVTILLIFNFLTTNSVFAIVRPDEVDVTGSVEGAEKIKEFGGNILAIILTIGVILSIIVLIILGIKYMFGTIEDKAKYKAVLLPYTIGMFLLFAAIPITNVLFDLSGALVESSSTEGTNNGGGVPEEKPDAIKRLYCTICKGDVIDKCKDKNNHPHEWRYKCNQCDFWSDNLNQQIGHSHLWENHAGEE